MLANHSDTYLMRLDLQTFAGEEEEIETPENVETDPAPTEPTNASTPQPQGEEFDEIVYNKEKVKIPVVDRQKYLQKGYHYDEVRTERDTLRQQSQMLDRVAKFYGYENHDEFQQAFEQAEADQRAKTEAQRLGMDEQLYRQFLEPVNSKLREQEQVIQTMRQQEAARQIEAEVNQLKSRHSDFDQYQDKVFDLAVSKGYSLQDAYIIVTHQEKLAAAQQQAEQAAIQKIKLNADTSTGALGQDNPDEKFGYSSMSAEERRAFREKVKRGET